MRLSETHIRQIFVISRAADTFWPRVLSPEKSRWTNIYTGQWFNPVLMNTTNLDPRLFLGACSLLAPGNATTIKLEQLLYETHGLYYYIFLEVSRTVKSWWISGAICSWNHNIAPRQSWKSYDIMSGNSHAMINLNNPRLQWCETFFVSWFLETPWRATQRGVHGRVSVDAQVLLSFEWNYRGFLW